MPSGPNLFDDEDGLEPGQRSDAPEPSDAATDQVDVTQRRRPSPNYLIRRAVVVGGVVAVLATASIVIGQLIGSGANETTSGAISAEWNRIVLVDDRTGRVVVNDADGDELSRIESGVRTPNASAIVGSTLIVAGDDGVSVVDIDNESIEEFELSANTIVKSAGSALTLIAPRPDGGRALLVHGPSSDVIDTDTFATVVGARYEFADSLSAPTGRHVLVTDSGNFQSVLFSFDRDEPSFFPGLALAVDTDLVVTAQNVGSDATINVFDHTGEPLATGRTPSVRAGLISGSDVVLVTVDGEVLIMSSSNGDVADATQLDIGTIESGEVTTSGDRLVVTGTSGTAIVDGEGAVVVTFDDQTPVSGQPPAGSTCIATITAPDETDAQIAVVDVGTGDVLVEAAGTEPVLADAAGCSVAVQTTDGFDLLHSSGVQQFQNGDTLLAVSLDGIDIATERGGRIVVFDRDIPDETTDLGPRGRTVHFTQS